MLNFMYRFDYDAGGIDQALVSPMIFNVKVYSITDKYQMLKSQAKEKFEKVVKTCWNMNDFLYAITEIYNLTPKTDRGLRDIVIKIICKHINALLEKQDFQIVLEETFSFAADVTQLMAHGGAFKKYQCYRCTSCDGSWETVLSPETLYYCICCGNSHSSWKQYVMSTD